MRHLLACGLFFSACASASHAPPNADLAGVGGICPAHPSQCGGKCCGATCVETMFDNNNCGDCGVRCGTNLICSGGGCACPSGAGTAVPCGTGQTCCGLAGCKSLMTDVNNCGSCGRGCGATGDGCSGGNCTCGAGAGCTGAQSCCSGVCSTSCVPPDMAMALPDAGSGGGTCSCSTMCLPGTGFCIGQDCCYEQAFVGTCMPAAPGTPGFCLARTYP